MPQLGLTLVRSCLDLSGEKLLASISILLICTMKAHSILLQGLIKCSALMLTSRVKDDYESRQG